jgi:uncharacterized protein YjbI with pentapeptide repeats
MLRLRCYAVLCCAVLCCAALRCAALRCAALRYATLRYATLRYATLRYATLRYAIYERAPKLEHRDGGVAEHVGELRSIARVTLLSRPTRVLSPMLCCMLCYGTCASVRSAS